MVRYVRMYVCVTHNTHSYYVFCNVCNFMCFYEPAAGRDYTAVSKTIKFLSGQSKILVMIPLLDNIYNRRRDVFFYVDIIFNASTIARSIVTIIDDDYGELTIGGATSSTNVLI